LHRRGVVAVHVVDKDVNLVIAVSAGVDLEILSPESRTECVGALVLVQLDALGAGRLRVYHEASCVFVVADAIEVRSGQSERLVKFINDFLSHLLTHVVAVF
jgi:hypothetical protein